MGHWERWDVGNSGFHCTLSASWEPGTTDKSLASSARGILGDCALSSLGSVYKLLP